jgi:hypothetical protein
LYPPRFFSFFGRFHLFANRDLVPCLDQARQIPFVGMKRYAAHGDIVALSLAALGEGDVEHAGGDERVVEKQFVKIAHPIKQKTPRILRLDGMILRHHGRMPVGGKILRLKGDGFGHRYPFVPVDPKPPAPRAVSSSVSTTSHITVSCLAITICAMRMPGSTVNGSALKFTRITLISPR